jgi:hypothetical protein
LAYSLNDMYRSLRTAMRLDGLAVGVGLGVFLLVAPGAFIVAPETGQADGGALVAVPLWPYRLAGGLLAAMGLHLLFAAQERLVRASTMLGMLAGNGLLAVVLLIAFLQRELAELSGPVQAGLAAVFLVALVSAGFALRYLREDYNMA